MTTERKGDWIQTYTGKKFYALDPREDEIDIEDIATALANTCRFAGHCINYYSVAEHCLLMSYMFEDKALALDALLHDATEAYLTDIPRPIKKSLPQYVELEDALCEVIYSKYSIKYPIDSRVKEIDSRILVSEARENMKVPPLDWNLPFEPIENVEFKYYEPAVAKKLFLERFYELTS